MPQALKKPRFHTWYERGLRMFDAPRTAESLKVCISGIKLLNKSFPSEETQLFTK